MKDSNKRILQVSFLVFLMFVVTLSFITIAGIGRITTLEITVISVREKNYPVIGKGTTIMGVRKNHLDFTFPERSWTVAGHGHEIKVGITYRLLLKRTLFVYELMEVEIIW